MNIQIKLNYKLDIPNTLDSEEELDILKILNQILCSSSLW